MGYTRTSATANTRTHIAHIYRETRTVSHTRLCVVNSFYYSNCANTQSSDWQRDKSTQKIVRAIKMSSFQMFRTHTLTPRVSHVYAIAGCKVSIKSTQGRLASITPHTINRTSTRNTYFIAVAAALRAIAAIPFVWRAIVIQSNWKEKITSPLAYHSGCVRARSIGQKGWPRSMSAFSKWMFAIRLNK